MAIGPPVGFIVEDTDPTDPGTGGGDGGGHEGDGLPVFKGLTP